MGWGVGWVEFEISRLHVARENRPPKYTGSGVPDLKSTVMYHGSWINNRDQDQEIESQVYGVLRTKD